MMSSEKRSRQDMKIYELKQQLAQNKREFERLKEDTALLRAETDRLEIGLADLKKKRGTPSQPSLIKWADRSKKAVEDPDGEFESAVFHNEDDNILGVYLVEGVSREYAEKCVMSLNALPQKTIIEICKSIIKCAGDGGENEDFELPLLGNAKDILNYCWFTDIYAVKPKSDEAVTYIVSGEGDWGECVSFVIDNETVAYVGADYTDSLDWLNR